MTEIKTEIKTGRREMDIKTTDQRLEDILQWQLDHDIADDKRFGEINKTLKNIPCKEDIKEIVSLSIQENLVNKGTLVKNLIIGMAVIVSSITAIAFGIKTIFAWFGIQIITPK